MSILDAIILGLIQGLTEFLPVSSSGHLVISEQLLGLRANQDIVFEVFVHFGTVLSILTIYYRDAIGLTRSAVRGLLHPGQVRELYKGDESFRMVVQILISAIPAGIVGILFEDDITSAFTDPKLVATMLIVTGLILFLTRLFRTKQTRPYTLVIAFFVGCAQALAILPGISRSGSTISMAMYWKVSPQEAARFSFLMSVPVILGATLLKVLDLLAAGGTSEGGMVLLAGTVTAFASGLVAIRVLLRIIEFGRIRFFAFYCLLAGSAGILFL